MLIFCALIASATCSSAVDAAAKLKETNVAARERKNENLVEADSRIAL
jgi:hypothetical protein